MWFQLTKVSLRCRRASGDDRRLSIRKIHHGNWPTGLTVMHDALSRQHSPQRTTSSSACIRRRVAYASYRQRQDYGNRQHTAALSYCSTHSSRIAYVFCVFFKIQKTRLFTFFEVSCQKSVKNVESVFQVFTFLHNVIANGHFGCKTSTHMSCYTYRIMLKLFIFGCLAIVRKTAKTDWGWPPWSSGYTLLLLRFFKKVF